MPANSVKITSSTSAMAKMSNPVMKISLRSLGRNAPSCKPCHALQCGEILHWSPDGGVRFEAHKSQSRRRRLYPALKLPQHQLADDVHAGIAIVEAGDRGKLLAAIMFEDFGVFLRDFFQRFQTIGGEAGHHDGDAAHAILCQFLDGLVGVGLQPRVEAKA